MKQSTTKRIGFTIGMMLLMGGWGLTWFVDKQQQAYPILITDTAITTMSGSASTYYPRRERWKDGAWIIYAAGIMLMVIGAGVTAFTLPLPEDWK